MLNTSTYSACAFRSMASLLRSAPSNSVSVQGQWNVPSRACGRVSSMIDRNSRTQSVKTSQRHCTHLSLCLSSNQCGELRRGFVRQVRLGLSHELSDAALAETGVGHVGLRPLPTRVAVVIVEPDSIDLEFAQHFAESVHAKSCDSRDASGRCPANPVAAGRPCRPHRSGPHRDDLSDNRRHASC